MLMELNRALAHHMIPIRLCCWFEGVSKSNAAHFSPSSDMVPLSSSLTDNDVQYLLFLCTDCTEKMIVNFDGISKLFILGTRFATNTIQPLRRYKQLQM